MKTFKWTLGDDFGLDRLDPTVAKDIERQLDMWINPESEFYVADGPWREEPDKATWVDDATGLDCMIHRSPGQGYLCGYVGVPETHPLHGCDDWQRIEQAVGGAPRDINFTESCFEGAPEHFGICHVPEPGRPANVWWIGFDCGHLRDAKPGVEALMSGLAKLSGTTYAAPRRSGFLAEVYRDFDCVRGYVTDLASGLAACAVRDVRD